MSARRIKPNPLKANSTVSLIAPAGGFEKKLFDRGREYLEKKYNFKMIHRNDVFDRDGYFAGSDLRRLQECFDSLTHSKFDAVFGIRGGYGMTHIYPELIRKLKKIKNLKPKIVLGYSDLTILLNGLYQDLGWVTFHGPMVVSKPFGSPIAIEQECFETTLLSSKPLGKITTNSMKTLIPGKAKGVLVGGCLSMLVATIGTTYEIQTKNKILFLEDVGERPYRIDRMLTQLLHAGLLNQIRGIIFGEFTNCFPPDIKDTGGVQTQSVTQAIQSALGNFLKSKKIPVITEFPSGHGFPQITFPIGTLVEMTALKNQCNVNFIESGCKE